MVHIKRKERFLYNIAFVLCSVFLFWFSEMSIRNNLNQNISYIIPMAVLVIFIAFISNKLSKIDNSLLNAVLIFFAVFVVRVILVIKFNHIPFNDFEVYLESAKSLANGNISQVANTGYYKSFPELLGFILWESALIKVLGYNLIALRIINCIISGFIGVVIYFIAKKVSTRVGIISSLLYAIYPSQIIMSSVMTNQHLSTLLYLLAILIVEYKMVNENSIKKNLIYGAIVGVIICAGNIIRPTAPPLIIAILLFLMLSRIKFIKKNPALVAAILIIPVSFFLFGKAYNVAMYKSGLTEHINSSSDLRYKFIVGLNKESNGQYSDKIMSSFWGSSEEVKMNMFKEKIAYNIKNPIMFINLIEHKLNVLFGIPDNSYYWLTNRNKEILTEESKTKTEYIEHINNMDRYEHIYNSIESSFNTIVYFMAALGVLMHSKKRNQDLFKLLVLILVTYIGVYCLIEVQARYRYLLMPSIIILASYSIDTIHSKFSKH